MKEMLALDRSGGFADPLLRPPDAVHEAAGPGRHVSREIAEARWRRGSCTKFQPL